MKFKNFVAAVQGSLFISFIIFTILAIFELLTRQFYDIISTFELLTLQLSIIFFILFLIFPYVLENAKKLGDKTARKYNQQKFKKDFFEQIKGQRTIDILKMATEYDVNLVYVKNFLRDQLSQGLLKGELKKDIFYVQEDFKIIDIKEKRINFMKENMPKFISAYKSLKIKDIASNFKVPKEVVLSHLTKLLEKKQLKGYLEEDTFYRDFSVDREEVNCPNCGKTINLNDL